MTEYNVCPYSELVYITASVDYGPMAVPFGNFTVVSKIFVLIKLHNKIQFLLAVKY